MAKKGYVYGHQEVNNTWKTDYSIRVTAKVPLWQVSNLTLFLLSTVTSSLTATFDSIFRGTKYSHSFVSQEISFLFLQI
jgi:hypothetical protein